MIIPGQFESWDFIINLSGVSIISLPEPVKKMIPALSNFFLSRLYKNYIIGLNFISRIIYKIACNFLDDVTVSKINVLDKKNDPKLFEIIRRDNIEEQFGGTAPNLPVDAEHGYFPPRMPSEHFIKDNENPQEVLITEDEYINKYKNGEIPEGCISPYLYDKIKKEEEQNNKPEIEEVQEIKETKPKNISNSALITSPNKSGKLKLTLKEQNHSVISLSNSKLSLSKKYDNYIKIRKFMNTNWNYDDELSFPKYHNINCKLLRDDNILNDINNFAVRKQNFIKKISLFNMKNSNISNY